MLCDEKLFKTSLKYVNWQFCCSKYVDENISTLLFFFVLNTEVCMHKYFMNILVRFICCLSTQKTFDLI